MEFIPSKEAYKALPEAKALLAEFMHEELVTPAMMVAAGTPNVAIEIPDGEVTVIEVESNMYPTFDFYVDGVFFKRYCDIYSPYYDEHDAEYVCYLNSERTA